MSIVIFQAEVRDQILPHQMAKRILQFHQLNKNIMFRIKVRRGLRRLEIERQPFLHTLHTCSMGQVHKQRKVEHQRRRKDRITAQEIDLDLHLITEPAKDVDVVPALLVVAPRGIVVDPDNMRKIAVKIGVNFGLEDVFEHRKL